MCKMTDSSSECFLPIWPSILAPQTTTTILFIDFFREKLLRQSFVAETDHKVVGWFELMLDYIRLDKTLASTIPFLFQVFPFNFGSK